MTVSVVVGEGSVSKEPVSDQNAQPITHLMDSDYENIDHNETWVYDFTVPLENLERKLTAFLSGQLSRVEISSSLDQITAKLAANHESCLNKAMNQAYEKGLFKNESANINIFEPYLNRESSRVRYSPYISERHIILKLCPYEDACDRSPCSCYDPVLSQKDFKQKYSCENKLIDLFSVRSSFCGLIRTLQNIVKDCNEDATFRFKSESSKDAKDCSDVYHVLTVVSSCLEKIHVMEVELKKLKSLDSNVGYWYPVDLEKLRKFSKEELNDFFKCEYSFTRPRKNQSKNIRLIL